MSDLRLAGKSIIVTGASAGMGKVIVETFVKEGASVVAVARRQNLLDDLAASLAGLPGKIAVKTCDMGNKADVEAMIDFALEKYGGLDVLVNNAGIMDDSSAIGDMTDEMYERVMNVNTTGPMVAMRKAVNVFLEQGRGGNIINIVSVGAFHNAAGVAYRASKAALVAASTSTAFMYLEEKIRCNAIAPGAIMTDIGTAMPPQNEFASKKIRKIMGTLPGCGATEDIAEAAMFLASDESKYINGIVLRVDGGWTNF